MKKKILHLRPVGKIFAFFRGEGIKCEITPWKPPKFIFSFGQELNNHWQ
jgi:hypothetical protein